MPATQRATPILALVLGLMEAMRWLTLQCYLRFLIPDLREREDFAGRQTADASVMYRRATAFDAYVLLWIALEASALVVATHWPTAPSLAIVQGLVVSRIIDLVRVGLNTSLFDQVTGHGGDRVESAPRLVLLALIAYVELMACFAVIYLSHRGLLVQTDKAPTGALDAICFSVLTQMTISFGNPLPNGWLKYVAALQGFLGLLLVALIIARMMSSLRPLKSLDENTTGSPSSSHAP